MHKFVKMLVVPAMVLAAACGRGDDSKAIDEGLKNDLALASSMYQPQQFVSPMEQGYAGSQGYAPARQVYTGYGYPAHVARPAPRIQRVPAASAPARTGTRVVKNTKRDAILGAAAGAAIGAVTSRDRLKGAVIGAAAGGLLGAVIGNNVDVKKIPY